MWIDVLLEVDVLVDGVKIIVFIYLGEKIIYDIYWNGFIGVVKKDFDQKVFGICDKFVLLGGDVCVLVFKVVVIQVSLVILMMLLYLLLLFKVMKEQGIYEGCIEQVDGLYWESLYGVELCFDEEGCLCVDYKELQLEVQFCVEELWDKVINENFYELIDFVGYKSEFFNLFGFEVVGVDYEQDVNLDVQIVNLIQV